MAQSNIDETSTASFEPSSTIELSNQDFSFVNHIHPQRFFTGSRPYRYIQTRPAVNVLTDVLYTPALSHTKPFEGCLYDSALTRIDHTCVIRDRSDNFMNKDAQHYDGNLDGVATYETPMLYLGFFNPHYGHFLTESLARWWMLAEMLPDVNQYLIHIHHPSVLELPYVKACLSALHIERSQLVYFDKPTRLSQVIVPEASFQLESHIYAQYRHFFQKMIGGFPVETFQQTEQPLYVSRSRLSSGVTKFQGEEKIETFLSANGVKVIHPQLLTLEQQVRFFNEHKYIFGFIGSGMHNIALSLEPKVVVYLTPHTITSSYFLIDKCFQAQSTYLSACTWLDRARWLSERLTKKVSNRNRRKSSSFVRSHEVDDRRAIRWFKQSGFC